MRTFSQPHWKCCSSAQCRTKDATGTASQMEWVCIDISLKFEPHLLFRYNEWPPAIPFKVKRTRKNTHTHTPKPNRRGLQTFRRTKFTHRTYLASLRLRQVQMIVLVGNLTVYFIDIRCHCVAAPNSALGLIYACCQKYQSWMCDAILLIAFNIHRWAHWSVYGALACANINQRNWFRSCLY